MDDQHLTFAELADWLRISVPHLQRQLKKGAGPPSIRLGRRIIFNRAAVKQWLEARTVSVKSSDDKNSLSAGA
jgi:excisionase family DNA binding protein